MDIELVPDLAKYPQICDAHKNNKLIVFVGAGVSALWGCKRWKDMAVALTNSCYNRGLINYWVQENLINKYSASPRKLITIAKSILGKDYLMELNNTLSINRKDKLPKLFLNLFDFNAIYITTNIDKNLSGLFKNENVYIDPTKYSANILQQKNIVHLHGVVDKEDSLVLTIDEYIARYRDNKSHKNFLEHIFIKSEEYCILFIGYGVDEMEIIDYMIEKYSNSVQLQRSFNRLFVLLPFFQSEEQLFRYEESYFRKINMGVIPYRIDENGYDQLNDVIETWQQRFRDYDLGEGFYKRNQIIEKYL